jgi:hypothetical protein
VDETPVYNIIKTSKYSCIFDKSLLDISILSKKAAKLMIKSSFYSQKTQEGMQSFWIRNYVKNVVYGNTMNYFLEEKGIRNNIFFNKKYYSSIKSVSGDILANIIDKKY